MPYDPDSPNYRNTEPPYSLIWWLINAVIWLVIYFACTDAHADPVDDAQKGALADVGTTATGRALGLHEANKLGIWTLPLKFGAIEYTKTLPEPERTRTANAVEAVNYGAAGHNLTLILSHEPHLAVAVGLITLAGVWHFKAFEREAAAQCEIHRQLASNSALVCKVTSTP